MRIISRALVALALMAAALQAQTPLAPNSTPIYSDFGWMMVDSISTPDRKPLAAPPVCQYGSPSTPAVWGAPFALTAGARLNYQNADNLGWTWIAGVTPYELDCQAISVAYTIRLVDLAGANPVDILVPALAAPPPPPPPVPAPPPPDTSCPAGVYAEIGGGRAGEQATVPAGTIYRIEPATACITAAASTRLDLSGGNLDILRTAAPQTIPTAYAGAEPAQVRIPAAPPAK